LDTFRKKIKVLIADRRGELTTLITKILPKSSKPW